MKLTIQAPGKLMLSGEWSVLEPGHVCLVGGFDRYVYCEFEEDDKITLNFPDLKLNNLEAVYEGEKIKITSELSEVDRARTLLATTAIETALHFLESLERETPNFNLLTDSVEHGLTLKDGSVAKTGLGTSAAVTVSIIGAFLKNLGFDLAGKETQDLIFKLSAMSHYVAQGKMGSGFDIAACTYGGALRYTRFDADWLKSTLDSGKSMAEIANLEWPGLKIEPLTLPKNMHITAAFCGVSASTKVLIPQINAFKTASPEAYKELIEMMHQTTQKLIAAIESNQPDFIVSLFEANRMVLQQLGELSGVALETPELKKMLDLAVEQGAAAKFSGAGGGDSVFAVCFDQFIKEDIEWAWEEAGFYPLDVFVSSKGVSVWY